jgi:hypothetical protein
MKYLLLALPATLFATQAFGQQVEYSGRATASFSEFRGSNAATTTSVNYTTANSDNSRAVNPFGKQLGTGGGLSLRAQRVGKVGLLTAFDLGYDLMQARTTINYLNYSSTVVNYGRTATGVNRLYLQAATAFAGVGWRLGMDKKLQLDALVGPELAYVVTAREIGNGTTSTGDWETDVKRSTANSLDFRLRGDVTVWRGQVGLAASYSWGFTNYATGIPNVADPQASIRSVRVGLAYRLK